MFANININPYQQKKQSSKRNMQYKRKDKKKKETNSVNLMSYNTDKDSLASISTLFYTSSNIKTNDPKNDELINIIIENIAKIAESKYMDEEKFNILIDILNGGLKNFKIYKRLHRVQQIYHILLTKHTDENNSKVAIFNSIYLFLIKIKELKKELNNKDLKNIEENLFIDLNYYISNFELHIEEIDKSLTILQMYISYINEHNIKRFSILLIKLYKNLIITKETKKRIYLSTIYHLKEKITKKCNSLDSGESIAAIIDKNII